MISDNNKKLFIKVAGAATVKSNVTADVAIARLKSTVTTYENLSYPTLIEIIEHKEIANGYVTVFEWFEGDCMGRQYHSYEKFISLPLQQKINIYNDILMFHIHVNRNGYVALDFYINTMGRMWGSSRYMSPEEFQLGEEIDVRSNVFLMGATAFQLLGGGAERNIETWQANEKLYAVALKAVRSKKEERYQSIEEYYEA